MRKFLLLIVMVICINYVQAQKQKFDSLALKLATERTDSNRVKLMWLMADASNLYNPDTALHLAQSALYLAQKIKYTEGESRSLGVLAMSFREMGNYQKALEFFLQKLQIEEKRNNPRNLASVLINIGILYINLEQYNQALSYYKSADSVTAQHHVTDLEYYINNNLGDVYERMNLNDSAFTYFTKAIEIATQMNDKDLTGTSIVGLGHVYLKRKNFSMASKSYKKALSYLEVSDDEDLMCEAALGLAKLYSELNIKDSAEYYAMRSYTIAKKDGFESRQLDAAQFLTSLYKQAGDINNAFTFLETTQTLKDSISSEDKVRALQIISGNEQLRQNEIAENKLRGAAERHQQLQMLLIGLFIPILFLITLLLSRVRMHQRIIKFLGIISLLMLFEYLLLVLNPKVNQVTNHTPMYEILIFVAVAAVLGPAHHRIEQWMLEKLTTKKFSAKAEKIKERKEPIIAVEPKKNVKSKPPKK